MAFKRSGVRSPSAPPTSFSKSETPSESSYPINRPPLFKMISDEPPKKTADPRRVVLLEWIAGFSLFAATAGIVIWQSSRLAVLWDLSYVLENASRISLGDMPYRDFPFPYAPLTFF